MVHSVQAPLTLDQVSKLFSNWRETRVAKGKIPESLLRAIAGLDTSHPLCKVAKELRLNQTELKGKLKVLKADLSDQAEQVPLEIKRPVAHSQGGIQVTKIVAVESIKADVPSSVEIVSPSGWVLRSSTGTIKELQILEFARAVSEVTV
jgi:hypothetical protein